MSAYVSPGRMYRHYFYTVQIYHPSNLMPKMSYINNAALLVRKCNNSNNCLFELDTRAGSDLMLYQTENAAQ